MTRSSSSSMQPLLPILLLLVALVRIPVVRAQANTCTFSSLVAQGLAPSLIVSTARQQTQHALARR